MVLEIEDSTRYGDSGGCACTGCTIIVLDVSPRTADTALPVVSTTAELSDADPAVAPALADGMGSQVFLLLIGSLFKIVLLLIRYCSYLLLVPEVDGRKNLPGATFALPVAGLLQADQAAAGSRLAGCQDVACNLPGRWSTQAAVPCFN